MLLIIVRKNFFQILCAICSCTYASHQKLEYNGCFPCTIEELLVSFEGIWKSTILIQCCKYFAMYFVTFINWHQNVSAISVRLSSSIPIICYRVCNTVTQLPWSQTPVIGKVSESIKEMFERRDWYASLPSCAGMLLCCSLSSIIKNTKAGSDWFDIIKAKADFLVWSKLFCFGKAMQSCWTLLMSLG